MQDETKAREVLAADEMLCDAIAGALAKYSVAYSHVTLADMSTAQRSWKVHEVVDGNPFDRDEWLGVFDNKQEANSFCAKLRRDAALQITARHRLAFQSEARAVPPDGERGFQARAESMMFPPNAERSELVAAIERAGWEAVAAIAEDRGDTNVAAQARARLSLSHQADREAIARVREALRVEMLDQTTTGKRKSYSDGYAQGICRAIQQIDAILALSGSLAPEGGEDARDGSATTVPIAVILPSLEGARATLEHFAKTLADSEPRKLPLAAAFAASEASRLAAAVMLLTPPSTEKGETK